MFTDGCRSVEEIGFGVFHAEDFELGLSLHRPIA
jgi:hypothetical protein